MRRYLTAAMVAGLIGFVLVLAIAYFGALYWVVDDAPVSIRAMTEYRQKSLSLIDSAAWLVFQRTLIDYGMDWVLAAMAIGVFLALVGVRRKTSARSRTTDR
ncbi:MAG TPA: hypothetical protein V6D08_04985 [Candidatus Obscuribacterales bacterium]